MCECLSVHNSWVQHKYTASKGYKCTYDEQGIEHMVLEGEKCQAHVRKDEVFSQEIQQLKQLLGEMEDNIIRIPIFKDAERSYSFLRAFKRMLPVWF